MQKITIDTRCTPFTCDTYNTFTGDYFEESYIDDQREQLGDDTLTSDDFDFEYDHNKIILSFGDHWCDFVTDEFDLIEGAKAIKAYSPKFYNYTTDSAEIEITCDIEKIRNYCNTSERWNEVEKITDEIDPTVYVFNGLFVKNIDEAMVLFYINRETERRDDENEGDLVSDYFYDMHDYIWEIYADNATIKLLKDQKNP